MTKSISELLGSVVKRYGLENALIKERMPRYWAEVVGQRVARISHIRSFEHGVLRVYISEPTWRTEITLRKEEIRCQLNERIGKDVVNELELK